MCCFVEFRTNGYWRDNLPVHPKLVPTKLQSMKSETDDHMFTCASKLRKYPITRLNLKHNKIINYKT